MQDVDNARRTQTDYQEVSPSSGKDEPRLCWLHSNKCMCILRAGRLPAQTQNSSSPLMPCICTFIDQRGEGTSCRWSPQSPNCCTVSSWCMRCSSLPPYVCRNLYLFTLATRTLDKTISNLEMELAAAKAMQESILNGPPFSESSGRRRYLMVIGINTAFSSRKRRDSVRATWLPQGSHFSSGCFA